MREKIARPLQLDLYNPPADKFKKVRNFDKPFKMVDYTRWDNFDYSSSEDETTVNVFVFQHTFFFHREYEDIPS